MARRRRRQRARFVVERLVLRGVSTRLLLAGVIIVSVALASGALVALLDGGFDEPGEAVWWAFLRLTDPGYLGDDEGVARRSISTVVTVLGYVLFLGMLIAILTQWLNETLSKLESGLTPLAISDHVLVLGWTHHTPTIVGELLRTRARMERFLARRGTRRLRIVILAEQVDRALIRELRERLGDLFDDRRVLLRSGTPLHLDHLERVAFLDAAVLILPGSDFGERNPEAVDAQTFKTLMAVSRNAVDSGSVPPLAVAELYDESWSVVADRAYEGASRIVAADEIVARLIAQGLRQRGLLEVFSELLSIGEGTALYLRRLEGRVGGRFRDLRGRFPGAVVLGMVRADRERPVLAPDPDTELREDDLIVFMARGYDDCVPTADPQVWPDAVAEAVRTPAGESARRVLLLGWSRKAPVLLRELERYGEASFEVDVVSATPLADREAGLKHHGPRTVDWARQIEASITVPSVFESLQPGGYDYVVLLASERLDEAEQADASTVFKYQMLRGLLAEEGPRPEILVEILEEENEFLFPGREQDVIVSPKMVSYLLSQVALRPELAAVFSELSRSSGAQIVLRPARAYGAGDAPLRFDALERAAAARGEIALGLRSAEHGLSLVPDRQVEWTLGAEDEVVVLRTERDAGCAIRGERG